ncbi:MAG TPA: DUF1957 domain-containing protein [Blastocatellia bacterium]|nr:DUF1957 domain-containing protein [Blastocatellia bacterium]
MPLGYFSLILHAHLPFVRHPEYPEFLEEDWLYEAITEVYLPLIFIFRNLYETGAKPRAAINLSPPLCEMLADPLLRLRYTAHLENLFELAQKEAHRTARGKDAQFHPAAAMYVENLGVLLNLWNETYRQDLIAAFRELQDEGAIEIITCGATHGFLPLISTPQAREAQISIAVNNYQKHFERCPRGIWLPECAYEPGIEDILKSRGIEYFIADSHAILYGDPRPKYGVHAPVFCPNGTAVFARDVETSRQVWSAEAGYPGDPVYREFYRDIGWDLPLDYLRPHLHKDGSRRHLGLKYHRISGRDVPQQAKLPYIPADARNKAAEHSAHFISERNHQSRTLNDAFDGRIPLIVSPYDAELFGHWWYEGPQFIDFLFRRLHYDQNEIKALTPGDYLDLDEPIQFQQPSASSWGESGYNKVWLNDKNSWMYPYQHDAERRMNEFAQRFTPRSGETPAPPESEKPDSQSMVTRILNQMARELLLAESSDWAFQIYQGTTVQYSTHRFKSHINRFDLLSSMLQTGSINEELLAEIENRDNIFPEVDYSVHFLKG